MGVPEILLRHISRALEAWRIVNSHPEIHDRIESVRASGRSFAANLFEGIGSLSCTEIAMLLVDLDVLYQVNHDFGLRDEFRERGLRAYWRWIEEQIEHINISRDDADGKAGEAERPPIDRAISVPLPENSISRDGDVWRFRFKGKDLPVMQHTQGLLYIAILIFNKNSSVPTRQLEGRIPAFGADEVIDAEGAQSLHESIMEKRAELEEAKEQGDIGRSELLSEQIGIEERELISATGLGGRRRKLSEDAERSRGRVGKAIGLALSKIESASRPLHEHLRSTLKGRRGRNPCYQGGQIEWEISPMALARGDHPVRVREAEAPFLGA